MEQVVKIFKDPWGFSKLDTYRECPAKFKFQFIEKRPQPTSPALERGAKMHDDIEAYLRGWITALPSELLEWKDAFEDLKKLGVVTEQAWGFDQAWAKLSDWFQKDTWLRAKSDAHYLKDNGETLVIIDFKSGQYRVPSTEQIELYAIAGLSVYPAVKRVTAQFWFIDANNTYDREYTAEHLIQLRKKYEDYVKPIYAETVWNPTPSRACKWCTYSISRGGPCRY